MKTFVAIEGNRTGYTPGQVVRKTMTVGELKEHLEYFNEDTPIMLRNDDGYTYGEITSDDVQESYMDDEGDEEE